MSLFGGRLCEVVCINPLLPPFNIFYSNEGREAWAVVPLSYASASGVARNCQPIGSKRGCGREVSPSHGREIF